MSVDDNDAWADHDRPDDSEGQPDLRELAERWWRRHRAVVAVVVLTFILTAGGLLVAASAMEGYRRARQGQTDPCLTRRHEALHQRLQREIACSVAKPRSEAPRVEDPASGTAA